MQRATKPTDPSKISRTTTCYCSWHVAIKMFKHLKKHEVAVDRQDFGFLVEQFVYQCLHPNYNIDDDWLNQRLRKGWPMLEEYNQRHIMNDIEVAIALDEPPRYSREAMEPNCKLMWQKFVKDLRPPKHPFTV